MKDIEYEDEQKNRIDERMARLADSLTSSRCAEQRVVSMLVEARANEAARLRVSIAEAEAALAGYPEAANHVSAYIASVTNVTTTEVSPGVYEHTFTSKE